MSATIDGTDAGWVVTLAPATDDDLPAIGELSKPWQLSFEDGSSFEVNRARAKHGDAWIAREVSPRP